MHPSVLKPGEEFRFLATPGRDGVRVGPVFTAVKLHKDHLDAIQVADPHDEFFWLDDQGYVYVFMQTDEVERAG